MSVLDLVEAFTSRPQQFWDFDMTFEYRRRKQTGTGCVMGEVNVSWEILRASNGIQVNPLLT